MTDVQRRVGLFLKIGHDRFIIRRRRIDDHDLDRSLAVLLAVGSRGGGLGKRVGGGHQPDVSGGVEGAELSDREGQVGGEQYPFFECLQLKGGLALLVRFAWLIAHWTPARHRTGIPVGTSVRRGCSAQDWAR